MPAPAHAPAPTGSTVERLIEDSGCAAPYYALEECMGEHDRAWAKCQSEVRALAQCNQAKAAAAAPAPTAPPPPREERHR